MVPVPRLPSWSSWNLDIPCRADAPDLSFCLYSDAFSDNYVGGLGGWAHGEFWHIPLSQEDCSLLHITAWEFIALGVNIIVFGLQLKGFRVHLFADALATVQILASQAAHSPIMQIIHDALLALPEFGHIITRGLPEHLFGECNALADAASRANFKHIYVLAQQLGITARRLTIPAQAIELISSIKKQVRALHCYEGTKPPPPSRPQTREELRRIRHLGSKFLGADDNPTMFKLRHRHEELDEEHNNTKVPRALYDVPLRPPSSRSDPRPSSPLWLDTFSSTTATTYNTRFCSSVRPSSPLWLETFRNSSTENELSLPHIPYARTSSPLRLDLFHIVPSSMLSGEERTIRCLAVAETSRIAQLQPARSDAPPPLGGYSLHVSSSTHQSKGPAGLLPPVPTTHILIDDLLNFKRPAKSSPLLQRLLSDTSEQALRPSDPSILEAYTSAVGHALEHADPLSSRDKNRTSWKYWTSFLTLMNSPPLRVPDPSNPTRDNFLKAAFLLWVRREAKSSIPGRSHIKAATALGHLYRVAKVHKNHDLEFTTTTVVRQIVKYLAREYAFVHGPEALAPRRREGLSRQMLRSMLANLDNLRIRSREFPTIFKSSWLGRTLKAALCLSSAGGFRKAEVSLAPGEVFQAMHM